MKRGPAAVYRHVNAAGEALYIGCSANPLQRTQDHASTAPWALQIARIDVMWFRDRKSAFEAEARLIQEEKPIYNGIKRTSVKVSYPPSQALADYLTATGLKKPEAAELFGISRVYIYGLLNGERDPSTAVAERIQRVTNGAVPVSSWGNHARVIDAVRAAA